MTPEKRANLNRLLAPRHVALVGGRDAEIVAGECNRIGFAGPVWAVNPRRETLGGHVCLASIDDLPDAPDAVFLAVPRDRAIEAVRQLRDRGAGGVVCYTAGFGETGDDGRRSEQALIEAAGDMALVGPNCYGLINYVAKVALWPFAHGPSNVTRGCAIITQSGMLASDISMSQRSVPIAHLISAGNQACLALEDFVDALVERDEVAAIGLHIEGLRDVTAFRAAAQKALETGVPIVALKSGTSNIGSRLTQSHTGSLSGTDDLYQALFDRYGIIRVHSPAQLLETLKFLCIAGVPRGNRVAGFTCSGGGATMLADHGEKIGLEFPQPDRATAHLKERLPDIATVSNPLDYTTPIWGDAEKLPPVFEAMFEDTYDAAIMVQDYPLPGLDESKQFYLNDATSFMAETARASIPAAICSSIPENLDEATRTLLCDGGVAPLQGINEALDAIAGAVRFHRARESWQVEGSIPVTGPNAASGSTRHLDEAEAKDRLRHAGLPVPTGQCVGAGDLNAATAEIGFPVVLKMASAKLLHKSEAGAVVLGLNTADELIQAADRMVADVSAHAPDAVTDRFLVERMAPAAMAEVLVSIRRDREFGLVMVLASGGTLVELVGDSETLLRPCARADLEAALGRLKVNRLIEGFRGKPPGDKDALLDMLQALGDFMAVSPEIAEIEINPVMVHEQGVTIVDVLMQVIGETAEEKS